MGKNKNQPEREPSAILHFQPRVTKRGRCGCAKRAADSPIDPTAQEGLRLFKAFFAIEDANLRTALLALLALLENIAMGTRAGLKPGRR
jgi:hypothetical protein